MQTTNKTFKYKKFDKKSFKNNNDPISDELLEIKKNKNLIVSNPEDLQEFKKTPIQYIHAPMGIGKTKALIRHINRDYEKSDRICVVSFRITFSNALKKSLPEFDLYSDINGLIESKRIIIQLQSTPRIENRAFDLLILDESESIFDQFESIDTNILSIVKTFREMVLESKHVILLDANMSQRSINIMNQIKPIDNIPYMYIACKNKEDYTYNIFANDNSWFKSLRDSIDTNEKIAIPITTIRTAELIYNNLSDLYPNLKIGLYTSKTAEETKKLHYSDVNNYLQYDVLIYTPTISAGVSFEVIHYDRIFAYFAVGSCNVETCIQMLGRIRNVSTKFYGIYVQKIYSKETFPITRDEVETYLESNGVKKSSKSLEKSLYYEISVENIIVDNLSKKNFIARFKKYIEKETKNIISEKYTKNEVQKNTEFQEIKSKEKTKTDEALKTCRIVSETEYKNLKAKDKLTDENRLLIQKYEKIHVNKERYLKMIVKNKELFIDEEIE